MLPNLNKIKVCPICKMPKRLRYYSLYFSKQRNGYRPQNYCKECEPWEKRKRSAIYFENHRNERLQYAKDYRANPENKDKRRKLEVHFKKKYRDELQDCYVVDLLSTKLKVTAQDVRSHPNIIQDYKALLLLTRSIKAHEKQGN